MNFSNQFTDVWNARFSDGVHPPQLDCLKADQFNSLLDQKQALEFEETKICSLIEDLKQQLNRENFTADFIHKCIQKLGAVSQVFNEIDQSDSKSSSSSGTTGRHPGSSSPPGLVSNGPTALQSNKGLNPTSGSTFPLFPQCIASSFIHSASPLLVAAAATSSAPFLLPSNLAPFSCPDSIKLEPDTEGRSSNFLSASEHSPYNTRFTATSSLCSNNNNNLFNTTSQLYVPPYSNGLRTSPSSLVDVNKIPDAIRTSENHVTTEAQAAAAAVAAAFGLGFPNIHSGPTLNHLGFGKDSSLSHGTHLLPVHATNGHMDVKDSSDLGAERPYQCPTCSRSFAVKAGLVQHMRTHTDERPYPCPHCGRAFKQKIQLTTHMRVHSGERPYGCRLCGKLFRQQSHVVQHLRTHTGEKPHKCYQCGKAFRQKYSLISHQRRMCRNRAASNPIAAGMTMWISPGVGGDTCNLVKEFSPTKSSVNSSTHNPNSSVSTTSPSGSTLLANSVNSPFSPFLSSPICTTPNFHSQFRNLNGQTEESHPDAAHCAVTPHRTYHRKSDEYNANDSAEPPDAHRHLDSEEEEELDEDDEEEEEEDIPAPESSTRLTPSATASQHPTALGFG